MTRSNKLFHHFHSFARVHAMSRGGFNALLPVYQENVNVNKRKRDPTDKELELEETLEEIQALEAGLQ